MDRKASSGDTGQPFTFCGITLFRRSGHRSKGNSKASPGQRAGEQGSNSLPAAAEPGTLKHPRRTRPDSPRDGGEGEELGAAFQPLKRQHSSSMEDDSIVAPPAAVAPPPVLGGSQGLPPAAPGPSSSAASAPQSGPPLDLAARRLSVETRSQSFPQHHSRGSGSAATQEGLVSPRRHPPHHSHQVCPPYGHKAVIGRRPKMEDAYSAVPFLLEVPISEAALDELVPPRIASHVRSAGSSASGAAAAGSASELSTATQQQQQQQQGGAPSLGGPGVTTIGMLSPRAGSGSSEPAMFVETLHFFGVFDGHGGADAAMHCAKTMHERVREVLSAITSPGGGSASSPHSMAATPGPEASSTSGAAGGGGDVELPTVSVEASVGRNASRASNYGDPAAELREAGSASSSTSEASFLDCEVEGGGSNKVEGLPCTSETVEAALTKAFHMTDEDFAQAENAALVGTTAVVALVGTRMLYVANCGDSRAVLCRNGVAVALTDDHKAAREDETARVEAAGGQILFWNGVRVMGVLAVSRAIGDHCLRPFVIAQPEVTIISRHQQDELLLLASDGLWDVMNNQEACTLAKKCLQRARQRGATRAKASSIAASVLVRAAVDRGSRDNVTVVIVDLSPATQEELDAEAQRSEHQHESSAGEVGGEASRGADNEPPLRRGSGSGSMMRCTEGEGGDEEGGRQAARPRRASLDTGVPSPFATLPPTAPSPFEQMQQQQQQQQQQQGQQQGPAAADAALLSPFGSAPLPLDDSF